MRAADADERHTGNSCRVTLPIANNAEGPSVVQAAVDRGESQRVVGAYPEWEHTQTTVVSDNQTDVEQQYGM